MNDSNRPADPTDARTPEELSRLEAKLDRVDELVSYLVDEVIDERQFAELEGLLQEDHQSRVRYIEDVQLHCDLLALHSPDQGRVIKPGMPVLGSLGLPDESGVHLAPPPREPGI